MGHSVCLYMYSCHFCDLHFCPVASASHRVKQSVSINSSRLVVHCTCLVFWRIFDVIVLERPEENHDFSNVPFKFSDITTHPINLRYRFAERINDRILKRHSSFSIGNFLFTQSLQSLRLVTAILLR